jgi:hypothetical protein
MKKISILSISLLFVVSSFAQDNKLELVQRINESYHWLQSKAVEHMVTLNLSPTLWEAVLSDKSFPPGVKHFAGLGKSLIEAHDYLFETALNNRCNPDGAKEEDAKPDCEKDIVANKSKLNVTINAANIKYTERTYRLMFGYTTVIDNFLAKGSGNYGFNRGWRPKSKELHIILVLSDTAKEIAVKWSADSKTATITAPAIIEVDEWDRKINIGLERGGTKSK